MDNLDEQIAKLKMQQRLEKEKNFKKLNNDKKYENEINLEQLIKDIQNGFANINGQNFRFKNNMYLDEKLQLPIPVEYFEERANTEINVALVNDIQGISFTAAYLDHGAERKKFSDFKIGFQNYFKKLGFSLKWIEEGEIGDKNSPIYYGTYETPTARGPVYNLIFFREYKGSLVIGTYNCFTRDIKTWEPIIKATLMLTKIK